MTTMKFKRFTKPQFLRRIARPLLEAFVDRFREELAAQGLVPPPRELDTAAYCQVLAGLMLAPDGLPDPVNEVLYALDEMASPEGQERLERAAASAGLVLPGGPEASPEDLALQVWLAAPGLLARAHNEQRLQRLSAFEHFGAAGAGASGGPAAPDPGRLGELTAALDAWFARHYRGRETTRIELYPLLDEYWFLLRHGGPFTRAATVAARKTEVLYFRPAKDDVVVYSPLRDELRINARTRGERELYRAELSRFLRGDEHYYAERLTYTLEPLRRDGAAALSPAGVAGLERVVLREIEVAWENCRNDVTIRLADDLFQAAAGGGSGEPIPPHGRLARATFEFQFADSARPRPVQLRLPNLLKVGRHCDARRVEDWLWKRGYRLGPAPAEL